LSLVFLILLFFISCNKHELAFNLSEELEYAQIKGDIFALDYMAEEADDFLAKGWTKVRNKDFRLGAYPLSKLKFIISERRPLYLFFSCSQDRQIKYPAEKLLIKINKKDLTHIDLEKGEINNIRVPISYEFVENGENTVEIYYTNDKKPEEKPSSSQKKKREFSLRFNKLLISSHNDLSFTKQFINEKASLLEKDKDGFVQKVPSVIDFYFDLPDNCIFEAQYKYHPSSHFVTQNDNLKLKVSVQKPDKKEQIVYQALLDKDAVNKKFKIDLTEEKGVTRIRLQAGNIKNNNNLAGYLSWSKASLLKKGKEKKKRENNKRDLKKLRQFISDKNTIVIILDAARADHFSLYGYFRQTTPNIDKFAQGATVFFNAFSESLSTRCSIGTLFTGFPLSVTSLIKLRSRLPEKLVSIAELFKINKFKTTGFTGVGNIGSAFSFNKGFDEYFELYKEKEFYRKSQEYLPYLFPWLESNKRKKFFLYIHFKEPHAIYIPLSPFQGMFSQYFEKKVDLTKIKFIGPELMDEEIEYVRACYDENLASADSVFGDLMQKIKELGLFEESIIIVTADHGELLGEHGGLFSHGSYFLEGGIHIPLIIRFPEDTPVSIIEKSTSLVKISDIFATLADIYQFKIPKELISGKSLLPLVLGADKEVNSHVIIEKREAPDYCYRTKKYKLYYRKKIQAEFYDLEKDPKEKNNLFTRDNIIANFMLADLKKWIDRQKKIRDLIFEGEIPEEESDNRQIDNKTLDNLKALGYIK
jgi:arylsulfatase A-like enzyme